PWGVAGGRPGMSARTVLNLGRPDERELGKIDMVSLKAGDMVTIMTPGGGGYGDPFLRGPEAVLADVIAGLVSLQAAEKDYGVIIVGETIDNDRTARIREGTNRPVAGFDFGSAREDWESVFDDPIVTEFQKLLSAVPGSQRARLRQEK